MTAESLRIIPLGGLGEIGRNMMVFEYGDDLLVVDTGLMFPSTDMLGVDIIIPDVSYVVEHQDNLRGIILTHGHEDHIGALPYVLKQLDVDVPIFGTRLTLGLVNLKLKEHKLRDEDLRLIDEHSVLELGAFTVEFFHVCHSIPDAVGVALHTPVGLLIHTSDFKFDDYPVDGRLTEVAKLEAYAREGVAVLLADSTNAESPGYTPSEREIGHNFEKIFASAPGRIIVSTFASNVSRIQQLIHIARKFGRRVGVVGRSMQNVVKMAIQMGYLDITQEELLTPHEMNTLPDREVLIVCTGSQGEPTSALVRMALGDHKHIDIREGDTVIVSAEPIPGNEELVNRTIDNLFRRGAEVYYHDLFDVHVSGHGSREDYKTMISLVQPRFFVPIHGEYRHLVLNAQLAEEMGIPRENIFVVESGQVLEFDGERMYEAERVTEGYVFVDGAGVGDVDEIVLRDRYHLAQDGFLVAIVPLDVQTGTLTTDPEILTRGFIDPEEANGLIRDAQKVVRDLVKPGLAAPTLSVKIKESLSRLCYRQTRRRPMILPVVLEV